MTGQKMVVGKLQYFQTAFSDGFGNAAGVDRISKITVVEPQTFNPGFRQDGRKIPVRTGSQFCIADGQFGNAGLRQSLEDFGNSVLNTERRFPIFCLSPAVSNGVTSKRLFLSAAMTSFRALEEGSIFAMAVPTPSGAFLKKS